MSDYNPMVCSLPGSSVHGILQARILEWVAIPVPRGILLIKGLNLGLLHCRQILYHLSHRGSPGSCAEAQEAQASLSSHDCVVLVLLSS